MACEICARSTHEWYDCPKKPDGYVPLARREVHKESLHGGAGGYSVIGLSQGSGLDSGFESHPMKASAPLVESSGGLSKSRNIDRHRPGYYADYQRKRRAALKVNSANNPAPR